MLWVYTSLPSDFSASGISSDGTIVIGNKLLSTGGYQGVKLSNDSSIDLPMFGKASVKVTGVSTDGNVVVGSGWSNVSDTGDFTVSAFYRWSPDGYGSITGPPGKGTCLVDVTNNGNISIYNSTTTQGTNIEVLTGTSPSIMISTPPSNNIYASGISSDGTIVGTVVSDTIRAFSYTNGELTILNLPVDFPETYSTEATGISSDGTTIIGNIRISSDSNLRPFVYKDGVMDVLSTPEGNEGNDSTLVCVSGDGKISVGTIIKGDGNKYSVIYKDKLLTESLTLPTAFNAISFEVAGMSDDGTIIVGNYISNVSSGAFKSVYMNATVPGVPTGVTIAQGNNQVTVSWTAPTNGGSPITGYTVTVSPGKFIPMTTTTTRKIITGIVAGTTYTVAVTASNAVGKSSPASKTFTTSNVPGAPTGVTVTPGNKQTVVTWTAPANGGLPITGYTVTATPGNKTVTTTRTSATITGLTAGTAYSFAVTATNVVGVSQPARKSATTWNVPGAPTGVTVTPGKGGKATVSWKAPANGGSPITGYTVTQNPGNKIVATSTTTSATINTTKGTYTYSVTATNIVGKSPSGSSKSITFKALFPLNAVILKPISF